MVPRAFAVPLYPVVPLVFFATCSYMLYSGLNYAGVLGWIGMVLLAVGVPLYCLPQARRSAATPAEVAAEKV